jgi:hypothetical protein
MRVRRMSRIRQSVLHAPTHKAIQPSETVRLAHGWNSVNSDIKFKKP